MVLDQMSVQRTTEQDLRSFLNQKLCEIADAMMDFYNPCGIDGGKCKGGNPNPCCLKPKNAGGMCQFWMHGKCQFENCDCKLWLCSSALEGTDKTCIAGMQTLELFAVIFGLAKHPLIGETYTGADKATA